MCLESLSAHGGHIARGDGRAPTHDPRLPASQQPERHQQIPAGNLKDQAHRARQAGRCDSAERGSLHKQIQPDSVNLHRPSVRCEQRRDENPDACAAQWEGGNFLSSPDCPQICPGGEVRAAKRLKDMVGTRRLELLTSTVSRVLGIALQQLTWRRETAKYPQRRVGQSNHGLDSWGRIEWRSPLCRKRVGNALGFSAILRGSSTTDDLNENRR